jgi:hypothetical protein
LIRAPVEPAEAALQEFYERLLAVLRRPLVREGEWRLLDGRAAWEGNWTVDCCIAWWWHGGDGQQQLMVVNYSPNQSQCYVCLPSSDLSGRVVRFNDLMGRVSYDREGADLQSRGLYLDLPPWHYHVFEVTAH